MNKMAIGLFVALAALAAVSLYGHERSTPNNAKPSGAVVNGGSSTTTLPTIQQDTGDVLPHDPVRPGDPTPTIPVGSAP